MVQRAVDAALQGHRGSASTDESDLGRVAAICVDAETRAAKAWRRWVRRKKLRELQRWNLTDPFEAVIEQVSAAGLNVRGVNNHVSAWVSTESLGDLQFDRRREMLCDGAGCTIAQIGQMVWVKVIGIDMDCEQVRAQLTHLLTPATSATPARDKRRGRSSQRKNPGRRQKRRRG